MAFPTANIKDDAFIVGKVKEVTKASDYQLAVIEYVESHDYGASCTLIMKSEVNQGYGLGWEVWKDITKLDTQGMEQAQEDVRKVGLEGIVPASELAIKHKTSITIPNTIDLTGLMKQSGI